MRHFSAGNAEAKRLVLIIADGLRTDLLYNLNPFPAVRDSPKIVAPYLRDIVQTRGAFGISHTRVPTESRPGHVAIIGGMYEDVSAVTKGWKTNPVNFDSVFNQSRYTFSFGSPDILPMFARGATPGTVKTWMYDEEDEDFTRETLFANFFQDNKTSFLFTADHGMSNIGNHGDGNPDSTRTPLIAWGAGIRGPLPDSTPSSHDAYSAPWGLSHLLRRDVEQADLAPLMSSILGINFPVNSVGVLPDVDVSRAGYLAMSDGDVGRTRAAVGNAKSVLEHYRVKHGLKSAHKIAFAPFPGLSTQDASDLPGSNHLLKIEHLVNSEKWEDARIEAANLIQLCLDGLRYLETYTILFFFLYDRVMLRTIVTTGYLGWSAFSAMALFFKPAISLQKFHLSWKNVAVNASALTILLAFYTLFAVQREPWTYYLYVAFPCYFWWSVTLRYLQLDHTDGSRNETSVWRKLRMPFARGRTGRSLEGTFDLAYSKPVRMMGTAFVSLQAMVLAYRLRFIWSMGISGGLAMIFAGWYAMGNIRQQISRRENIAQLSLTGLSVLLTSDSVRRLVAKEGLPFLNQAFGWLILVLSALLPILFPFRALPRSSKQLTLFLAFAPCFVILAICAEGLFYLAYCATLIVWVEVEATVRRVSVDKFEDGSPLAERERSVEEVTETDIDAVKQEQEYSPRLDDVRIALFFLFFVQVAFFGTGKSFYLEPVYRLVPVFSPFIMATLLIFKIIAPYVMLSAAFATLSVELRMPHFSLFLIALSLTDGMTITFFALVTDTGSWLEIGQSISFFVITSLLLVWSAGICALGEWLMRTPHANVHGAKIDAILENGYVDSDGRDSWKIKKE
ncbi:hypothetical protein EW145_g3421 [Phellinidium pouzarii]|uniref:GPI ethanolamine phosphate transferase 1 n=1 Tax=Phellinidium pouzarii TaxID=167371 RepID=A0A4V3XCV9_9AGAM|nr:hypothetical protein EW145_g3421 [Phellinidium pouzarii]